MLAIAYLRPNLKYIILIKEAPKNHKGLSIFNIMNPILFSDGPLYLGS